MKGNKFCGGVNLDCEAAAAGGVEAGGFEMSGNARTHGVKEREESALQERKGRGVRIVSAAFEGEPGRLGSDDEGRKNRLKNKRGTASAADVEVKFPWSDVPWLKEKFHGTERGAFHVTLTDFRSGLDCGQVLAEQPRFGAAGADLLDAKGLAGDQRERKRCPEDLSAALTL